MHPLYKCLRDILTWAKSPIKIHHLLMKISMPPCDLNYGALFRKFWVIYPKSKYEKYILNMYQEEIL